MRIIYLLFIVLIPICCTSQEAKFMEINSHESISQSEIFSIFKDSRGFMWFGTVDGLNRFDGYTITVFNTNRNDSSSLSNNTIRSIAEDQTGRIWIGTDDGLCVYCPFNEKITQINFLGYKLNDVLRISSLLQDGRFLWVATSIGLFRADTQSAELDTVKKSFHRIENFSRIVKSSESCIDLEKSKDGSIWVATLKSVSKIFFNSEANNTVIINEPIINVLSAFKSITEDKKDNLWVTSINEGIARYNAKTNEIDWFKDENTESSLSSDWVSSSVSDSEGNIWFGTIDKGLNKIKSEDIDNKNISFIHYQKNLFDPECLKSNLVYSLYVSDDNLLWVGLLGSGINFYDSKQKAFNHIKIPPLQINDSPSSNFIRTVFADKYNRVWIGPHNSGLFIYNRNTNKYSKAGFDTQALFMIMELKEDKFLVCGNNGLSLVKFNYNDELRILNLLYNDVSLGIVNSCDSIFWLATLNGIFRLKIVSDKLVSIHNYNMKSNPAISENNCRVLLYDKSKNELWVGTEGAGLNQIQLNDSHFPVSVTVYNHSRNYNSLSNNYVRSLLKDKNNNIWAGTYEGINLLVRDPASNSISFKTYSKTEGLPNNMVQLIEEDGDGNLWIGSNGGLTRFNPTTNQFTNYTESDGLQSSEFSEHTSFKNSAGEIFVGGTNGISSFYPNHIMQSTLMPNTTITDFYLFNRRIGVNEKVDNRIILKKSISLTDSIKLQPGQNDIRFDFSALLYSYPNKIQYAYKLEGYDKEWVYTTHLQRSAVYTNLRHGKYSFKVMATNSDGVWKNTPAQIFIHIKTPFAYTWFAYLIYLTGIVMTFAYFTRFSIIRITTKKKILLENEHNQRIHELDSMRTRFFINISHDLRTPLTLINGPVENLLRNQKLNPEFKNQLELVGRNVKRLKYLVEQLLDVRKAESGKLKVNPQSCDIVSFAQAEAAHFDYAVKTKNLTLNITSVPDIIYVTFDPAMISKVFFNLLSNSVKHTKKGEINIRISKVLKDSTEILTNATCNEFVKIEVQDTGQGIPEENIPKIFERFYHSDSQFGKGYGIGLSHCKDLIEAHSGFIESKSIYDEGTSMMFYLPNIETDTNFENVKTGDNEMENDFIAPVPEISNDIRLNDKDLLNTVLVIEDNQDMLNYINAALSKKFKIFKATNGKEGLEKATDLLPDLIISDVMMPEMDGVELCRQIKANIKTSHIPVILLTARVDAETKHKGIEFGADDYISKPFEMEYLQLRIKNLLKTREHLRNLFQKNVLLEPSAITVTSLDEKFISDLMAAIEKGIPDPYFTVNSLESVMGMSHTNFYRKIKSLTGMSGKEILQNMRMKRAYQLFNDNKGLRVSEVAYMVGFQNPKYFSKSFKEVYGFIPSDFGK